MNLSRNKLLGRLVTLLRHGREKLGNFQRPRSGRHRGGSVRSRHVLDVVVKSSRQEKLERARRWRRFLKWAAVTGAVVAVAASSRQAVARYFWDNPDLRLAHTADIRTDGTLTHDEILRHAGLSEQTHLYDVDLRAARERLEALPNVRQASVERELPGRLVIAVQERRPVLWVISEKPRLRGYTSTPALGGRLIDEEGHLFQCTELTSELIHLPALNLHKLNHTQAGAHLSTPQVKASLNLLQRLRDSLGPHGLDVTEINAPNDWSLVVKLSDDLTVTFGYEDVDNQFERLTRILEIAAEKKKRLRTVNLLPRKNVPVRFADDDDPSEASSPDQARTVPVVGRPTPPPAAPASRSTAPEPDPLEAILGGGR